MKCENCGKETDGRPVEGGHIWSICPDCYERYFAPIGQSSIMKELKRQRDELEEKEV